VNPGKGRVAYIEAGEAHRLAFSRAVSVERTTPSDWKVFGAALTLTVSYSKLTDRVGVAEVAALAGVHEKTARASLKKWSEAGVIEWQPQRGGRGIRSTLSLPQPGDSDPVGTVFQPGQIDPQPGHRDPVSTGSQGPDDLEGLPSRNKNRGIFNELTAEDTGNEEEKEKVLALLNEFQLRSWPSERQPLKNGSTQRKNGDGSANAADSVGTGPESVLFGAAVNPTEDLALCLVCQLRPVDGGPCSLRCAECKAKVAA
jgi:hypothetical protein